MYWESTYVVFAENLSLAETDPINAQTYLYTCLNAIINLQSGEDGTTIARNFLYSIWDLWVRWASHPSAYDLQKQVFANSVNKFTLNHYNSNLADFVNNLNWTNGCVPITWAQWAENAGYDISEWSVCS